MKKVMSLLRCAEMDLFGLISDYMDLDPETADIPQAQTWREIKEYLENATRDPEEQRMEAEDVKLEIRPLSERNHPMV